MLSLERCLSFCIDTGIKNHIFTKHCEYMILIMIAIKRIGYLVWGLVVAFGLKEMMLSLFVIFFLLLQTMSRGEQYPGLELNNDLIEWTLNVIRNILTYIRRLCRTRTRSSSMILRQIQSRAPWLVAQWSLLWLFRKYLK